MKQKPEINYIIYDSGKLEILYIPARHLQRAMNATYRFYQKDIVQSIPKNFITMSLAFKISNFEKIFENRTAWKYTNFYVINKYDGDIVTSRI